jgi:hypothetical protein
MVNQNLPHDLCGQGKEMSTITPIDGIVADQAQISLMHQRGRLQGMAASLPGEATPGNLS